MKKILFFGGKGGVGKTTCASGYAVKMAEEGNNVLLISTDPAHSISDLFKQDIGSDIINLRNNLDALEINPEKEAKDYIKEIRNNLHRIVSPIIIDEINKQLDAASVSPGTHEAALFDKMIKVINETANEYDYIIFDTAPTGHTIRLLTLPELLGSWINSLLKKRRKAIRYKHMANRQVKAENVEDDPIVKILRRRRDNLKKARKILIDNNKLSFVFVMNAERLPFEETKKATKMLDKYEIPIETIIINRILPDEPQESFWKEMKENEIEYVKKIEKYYNKKDILQIPLFSHDISGDEISDFSKHFK